MDSGFDLPVQYKNKEILFPAEFLKAGYSYKIQVDVYGQVIMFEPDEERNWRALVNVDDLDRSKFDLELLHAIVESLEALG